MLRYSFDIFDTLLTRITNDPLDVFYLVQRRIGTMSAVPDRVRRIYPQARIWSEFRARRCSGREDVSLAHIYDTLDRELSLGQAARDALLYQELEVERDCSVPIAVNVRKARNLQADGYRVIFISDMYLPTVFLHELLADHGICREESSLYVSGEVGLTKGSGSLFGHVLEREGLAPDQLVHCGDHYFSDVIVPSRLGIRTEPYSADVPGLMPGRLRRKLFLGRYLLMVLSAKLFMQMAPPR